MSRIAILDKNHQPDAHSKRWLLKDTNTGDYYIASGVVAWDTAEWE